MFNNYFKSSCIAATFCLLFNNQLFTQQNLVPNPSFEQYSNCPNRNLYLGTGNLADIHKIKPDIWYKPDFFWGGYFNACANTQDTIYGVPYNSILYGSYQYARTGEGYLTMFYLNGGSSYNYFQVKLLDSLKQNHKYYAEHYVSLQNDSRISCNNQGLLFTKNAVYVDTANPNIYNLPANPQVENKSIIQDTLNWVKVAGVFTAQGGEQYLTIGNFRTNATSAFTVFQSVGYGGAAYYVDDVAVYNLDSFCLKADAGRDTTIKVGDSVFIGSYTNGIDSIKWYNANGQVIDSTRPGFWVKPTTTGTSFYVLQQTVNGCYSADTVYINAVLPLNFINYNIISNGVRNLEKSVENIWTTANEINVSHFNIQHSLNAKDFATIGKVKAKNKNYNEYSFTDQLIPNTQYPTHLYYRVVGVDFDGKFSYSQVKKLSTVNYQPSTINIYPNPTKGLVHILIPSDEKAIWTITVQDVLGKVMRTTQTTALTKSIDMQVSNQRGMYFITLTNNKTGKRIVE